GCWRSSKQKGSPGGQLFALVLVFASGAGFDAGGAMVAVAMGADCGALLSTDAPAGLGAAPDPARPAPSSSSKPMSAFLLGLLLAPAARPEPESPLASASSGESSEASPSASALSLRATSSPVNTGPTLPRSRPNALNIAALSRTISDVNWLAT